MGSRKHERGRIHMKGMIQILGIFYSVEKEASTLGEKKKMDKQNREPNQNHQAVGEPESNSIQESYYC